MSREKESVTESRFDQDVSRRKLLKILAASGGAVAASTVLPGRWVRPIVDLGVLPAHAQLSRTGFGVDNLRANESNSFDVAFDYYDELKRVGSSTEVSVWIDADNCSEAIPIYNQTLGTIPNATWGGAQSGRIEIHHIYESACASAVPLCDARTKVQLYDRGTDRITDESDWENFGDYANASCDG